MNPCKYNDCRIGFDELCDRMTTLQVYSFSKDKERKRLDEELEWFTYCPHCGNRVKDLLQSLDKTV